MAQNNEDEITLYTGEASAKGIIDTGCYVLAQIEAANSQDELEACIDFTHETFGPVRLTFSRQ